MPTRKAPSARENSNLFARFVTKKQHPSSVSTRASSSRRFATDSRRRGTSMKPNTRTARKNTASAPSDVKSAPAETEPPTANPVATDIAPTQIMSSHTDVPITYFANGRFDQPFSSSTFARSVVAESHIATPRKNDAAGDHPKKRVPTV